MTFRGKFLFGDMTGFVNSNDLADVSHKVVEVFALVIDLIGLVYIQFVNII